MDETGLEELAVLEKSRETVSGIYIEIGNAIFETNE